MDDRVSVENNDHLVVELNATSIDEQSDEEKNLVQKKQSTYVSALLKNIEENNLRQTSARSIVQKKKKCDIKPNEEVESNSSYLETKPGSEFRNPRDKAGKNKVHRGRQRSCTPPKKVGNSLKIRCTFCSSQFSNRAERRRTLRQQRSIVNWKEYDY